MNYDNIHIYNKDLVSPFSFIKALENVNKYFVVFAMWENTMMNQDETAFKNLDPINNVEVVKELLKLCWATEVKDVKTWNPKPFQKSSSKCLGFYLISTSGNTNEALERFYKKVYNLGVLNAIHIPPIIKGIKNDAGFYKKKDECITIDYNQDIIPVIQDVFLNNYSKTFLKSTVIFSLIGELKRVPNMIDVDDDIKNNLKVYYLPYEDEREKEVNDILDFDCQLTKVFKNINTSVLNDELNDCINPSTAMKNPNNRLKVALNKDLTQDYNIDYDENQSDVYHGGPTNDQLDIYSKLSLLCKNNELTIKDFSLP